MILDLNSVYLSYTKDYYQLHDVTFHLDNGETKVILGERESGKSSITRIIVGLERAQMGSVTLNGIDVEKFDYVLDASIGYIPSNGAFLENKDIVKNLEYVLKIRKIAKSEISVKVRNALSTYGLDLIKGKKLKDLTNMERFKVSVARLSMRNLDMIVVDDVFASLNDAEIIDAVKYLKELQKLNGCTMLICTSSSEVADMIKAPILRLQSGTIIKERDNNG